MKQKVIVSISTIPPRFGKLGEALNSLLNQKRRADEIHVYIPRVYRRFPDHEFCEPAVPDGVLVKVVEEDYGPATKILPCARAHRYSDIRIVYGDDDRFAQSNWLDSVINATKERPGDAIVSAGMTLENYDLTASDNKFLPKAQRKKVRRDYGYLAARARQKAMEGLTREARIKPARAHYSQSGYVDFALGLGGVSVKPDFFDDACFDIPDKLWAVDDIWLSGHLARQGIGIWASSKIKMPVETRAADAAPLALSTIEGYDRYQADRACIAYMRDKYGVWT